MKLVSIVVPLYNEEENVEALYKELTSVIDDCNLNAEFVLVDDGSSDSTVEKVKEIAGKDPRLKLVCFRRNFGQTAAMQAGFDHTQGDIVITLDGDLQNDPAEIPRMIEKLEEGYDLVAGWRKDRKDKLVSRKLPSMLANRLISKITNVQLHDYGCTLKAMSGEVARNLHLYGEMHRFIPALAAEMGVKIAEIPVNHRPRLHGESKYGISRTFRVLLDLLTVKFFLRFSTRPLHMFGIMGMVTGGLGAVVMAYLAFCRMFLSMPLADRPLLLVATMLVLIGSQFICFGLLAEILVRTHFESQGKKTYTVRDVFSGGGRDNVEPLPTTRFG